MKYRIDKYTHLILDVIQWIMDVLKMESEKFHATNQVQYGTLLI
jgi:hypothetical protein